MAIVWAARMKGTRGFQKLVAVKTMLPELSQEPQFEEMFLAEAELAARIRHPHVCEILDLGEQDGTIYIVMEWIDGEPLSALQRMASRAKIEVPMGVATRLVFNAAMGLHAAHELKNEMGDLVGLVHRDVSPQNILISYDGVVKIVDFGVAKATAEADANRTRDGQIKGKAAFMSPEQALGRPIDRRTDVFALGIVLYQLVAGRHPFRGENDMVTMRRISEPEPVMPLSALLEDCPPSLDSAVSHALAKDASKRLPSMLEFARSLERALVEIGTMTREEDLSNFVRTMLGDRAEKRRSAIKEGLRLADERAEQRKQMLASRDTIRPPMPLPPPFLPNLTIPPPPDTPVGSGSSSGLTVAGGAVVEPNAGMHPMFSQRRSKVKAAAVLTAALAGAVGGFVALSSGRSTSPAAGVQAPSAAVVEPPAPVATPAPAPAPKEVPSAAASASAATTPAKADRPVKSHRVPPTKATTAPTTTTKGPNNLPKVRDPGF
jgi:serine/threonine-protein kinase